MLFPLSVGEDKYPTVLHFACEHGLMALVSVMLEQPGAITAATIPNRDNLTPADLAEANGHRNIAALLKNSLVCYHAMLSCIGLHQ